MRKLASIQKILKLEPIEGADRIEKATVLGWELVVKKNEFRINDLCIYCEVDSVLPEKSEFEFMRDRKFRIKTIKLKGQISQGICFPLSILPSSFKNIKEDVDVTNVLEITKYETPSDKAERLKHETIKINRINRVLMRYRFYRKLFLSKETIKSSFPAFIKKTDETRIQLFPNICEDYKDLEFEATEKLDGQSATYFLLKQNKKWFEFWKEEYEFGVCSRNFHLVKEDTSSWWRIAKKYDIRNKLLNFIKVTENDLDYVVIQGEIIGEGIQGNKYAISDIDFYMFNSFTDKQNMNNILMRSVWNDKFKFVPLLETNFKLKPTISENIEFAKGKSTLKNVLREGIVVRNYSKSISFKIINPEFLIKFDC